MNLNPYTPVSRPTAPREITHSPRLLKTGFLLVLVSTVVFITFYFCLDTWLSSVEMINSSTPSASDLALEINSISTILILIRILPIIGFSALISGLFCIVFGLVQHPSSLQEETSEEIES